MVYKFIDKKTASRVKPEIMQSKKLDEELHKPIFKNI